MEKGGQVTVFFIIGAIILILLMGYFGMKYVFNVDLFEQGVSAKLGIPEKIKPVQEFFDSCVENVAKKGITQMALGGGYINFKEDNIPTSFFNPIGKNLEIIPNSDFKVAMWYREKGNGLAEINMPTTEIMENELGDYINKNFVTCLKNLTIFFSEGYAMTSLEKNISTDVEILSSSVKVSVNYPIEVVIGDANFILQNHEGLIITKYGKLYNIAKEMFEAENTNYAIENKTLDMLIAYDPEIPYAGVENSCTPKIWSKIETILKIKDALLTNVAAMKIKGTDYKINDERFKYMELDMIDGSYDVAASLMYSPSWPTVIDITPSQGDLLKGTSMSENGAWYMHLINKLTGCISTHHFVYDLKYPVLITIKDPGGEEFQFATEIIIDNNQPRINKVEVEPLMEMDSPICKYPNSDLYVSTVTYNAYGQYVPIDNVDISLKCYPTICNLGTLNSTEGALILPSCLNGILVGNKEGYFNGKTMITTKSESYENEAMLVLEPIYKKKVKVLVIDKKDGSVRKPYESEEVIFQFTDREKKYETTFLYPDDTMIDLIAGNYKISSKIYANSTWPISTPKQTVTHCIESSEAGLLGVLGLAKDKKCIKTEIDSMEIDYAMKGGDEFEFLFEREELASTNELILYVMAGEVPSNIEEIIGTNTNPELNQQSAYFRYPEL